MDILNYAAAQRNAQATQCQLNIRAPAAGSIASTLSIGSTPGGGLAGTTTLSSILGCWDGLCKCLLVCKVSSACGFKVCDASGYYRCGFCCAWTVPAGVTFAQFQLWGPGGGAGTACCCGGSFFGPTGSYAVFGIPVVAGCTYTLCAGCAYCCYSCNGSTTGVNASPTYVIGYNLTNACADAGVSCMTAYNMSQSSTLSTSCCVWYGNISGYGVGLCSCTGSWEFCASSTAAIESDYSFSCVTKPYGTVSGTGSYAYGIPGMYPKFKLIGSFQNGSTAAAPVFGFPNCMCVFSYNGNTCLGCCYSGNVGYMQYPGQGGYASAAHGGCIYMTGDAGRMGMVCVSYC